MPVAEAESFWVKGIPLSSPTPDANSAQDTLRKMQAQYPGQLFYLDQGSGGREGITVSWIPSWYLPHLLNGLLYSSLLGSWDTQKIW